MGSDPISEPKIDCHVHVLDPARFPYNPDTHYAPAGQELGTARAACAGDGRLRHAPRAARGPQLRLRPRQPLPARHASREGDGRFKGIAVVAQRHRVRRARGAEGRRRRRRRVERHVLRRSTTTGTPRRSSTSWPISTCSSTSRSSTSSSSRSAAARDAQRAHPDRSLRTAHGERRRRPAGLSRAARPRGDAPRVRQALGSREVFARALAARRRAAVSSTRSSTRTRSSIACGPPTGPTCARRRGSTTASCSASRSAFSPTRATAARSCSTTRSGCSASSPLGGPRPGPCRPLPATEYITCALRVFWNSSSVCAAHRGVDVQVRHAHDGAELLQHEENDAVVDHAAPVAPAHEIALFRRKARLLERGLRIDQEARAMHGLDQPVQEFVQPIRLDASREVERIRARSVFPRPRAGASRSARARATACGSGAAAGSFS